MKVLLFSAFAVASCVVSGQTIGWWHFDEALPGEASTAEMTAVNAVSDEYGAGTYQTITNAGAGVLGQDQALMPGFYAGWYSVYDPVSESYYDNPASARFTTVNKDESVASGGGLEGGVVVIPDCQQLRPANSFTIEGFVWTSSSGTNKKVPNTMVPLFGRPRSGSFVEESFGLCMLSNGKLFARLRTGSHVYNSGTSGGKYAINDSSWHHVAFTYDSALKKARVYVDYALDLEMDWEGGVSYKDGDALYIGGYRYTGRKFDGCIDEVRLSDVALPPESFLRFKAPKPAVTDDDTQIFANFDGLEGDLTGRNLNLVDQETALTCGTVTDNGTVDPSAIVASAPGDRLLLCAGSDQSVEDLQSIYMPKSGYMRGHSLNGPTKAWGSSSFTVECFFRCDVSNATSTEAQKIIQVGSAPIVQLSWDHAKGTFGYVFNNYNSGAAVWTSGTVSGVTEAYVADGRWHHAAIAYDKDKKTLTFTVDYANRTFVQNAVLGTTSVSLRFGSSANGKEQNFCGWFDGVRVTARALSTEELLRLSVKRPTLADDDTLVFANFEGDLGDLSSCNLNDLNGRSRRLAEGVVLCRDSVGESDVTPVAQSDSIPGAKLVTGLSGAVGETNTVSLHLPKDGYQKAYSLVCTQRSWATASLSVECFFRVDTSYSPADGDMEAQKIIQMGANPVQMVSWDRKNGTFYLIYNNHYTGSAIWTTKAIGDVTGSTIADGKWHYLATIYDIDKRTLTFVVDKRSETFENVVLGTESTYLRFGGNANGKEQNFCGWYDGIRVTARALTNDELLRIYKEKKGVMLLVR